MVIVTAIVRDAVQRNQFEVPVFRVLHSSASSLQLHSFLAYLSFVKLWVFFDGVHKLCRSARNEANNKNARTNY